MPNQFIPMRRSLGRISGVWVVFILAFQFPWLAGAVSDLNGSIARAEPLKKGKVNINTCSKRELIKKVPGMTSSKAQRIIKGRPYSRIYELVTKKILTKKELSRIRDFITVKDP